MDMIFRWFYRIIILLSGLIIFTLNLSSQTTFQKTYGTELEEYGAGIVELPDGNFLMLAQASFNNLEQIDSTDDDIILMIVNSVGNIQSSIRYSLPGNQEPISIIKTIDGGYLIAGSDFGDTNQRSFLLRLNNEFQIVWSKLISTTDRVLFHMLKEDNQGNIYFGADCIFGTYPDILLIKMDPGGNELWRRTWGLGNNDHIYDIHFGINGNLYVVASFWFPGAELVVLCLDQNGQSVWEKSLFRDHNYYPRSFVSLENGEIVLFGKTAYENNTFVIKFDAAFNPVWSKLITIDGELFTPEAGVFSNGSIYLFGDFTGNSKDIALLNISTTGNINWMKGYGGEGADYTKILFKNSIIKSDNGLYLVANTESFGSGMSDIYLIKTDFDGNSGCNEYDLIPSISNLQYTPYDVSIDITFNATIVNATFSSQPFEDFVITQLCPVGIQAEFTSDKQFACVFETINFFDLSQFNPVSWNWIFEGGNPSTSTEQHPQNILYTEQGIYDVTLTVSDGSMQSTIVKEDFIHIIPLPEVQLGNDTTLCTGDTIMLCAQSAFQQYLWQDGSTDSCFLASSGGIYWVQVTDENGCMGRDTINLTFLPDPDIWLGNDTLVCFNEVLVLDAGEGFESYLWQDGSDGQTYVVIEQGTYWVEVANECGSGGDTINVYFTEPFEFTLGSDTSFCYGQSIILDPGSGYANYLWQNGTTNQTMTVYSTGTYWVTVTDEFGCTQSDSLYVEVFLEFTFSLGADTITICEGEYIFLYGPEDFESYLWQDGSNFQSILADTEGIYWLEISDEHGCAARDSVHVFVDIIPDDLLGADAIICPDETITLQAPPGYWLYVWQDGSTGMEYSTNSPGEFWVTVQNEHGCFGSDTMIIEPFAPPTLGLGESHWICEGDSILLSVGEDYISYHWQDGSQTPNFWTADSGFYKVQVETICGTYNDSVEIYFHQSFMDIGNDTIIHSGEVVSLYPGPGFSNFSWSTGSTDSILHIGEAGTYWLEAFDGDCYITDSIRVDVFSDIRVPNVFTPNSDGYNDTFYVNTTYSDGIFNFKMTIFNRWGRIVHEMNSIHDKWDGKINGSNASEGVYFWICDYQTFDRTGKIANRKQQGSVTILR